MAIPDTPTLRLILLKPGVELDGIGMPAGATVTLPRLQAIAILRNGNAELLPELPYPHQSDKQP